MIDMESVMALIDGICNLCLVVSGEEMGFQGVCDLIIWLKYGLDGLWKRMRLMRVGKAGLLTVRRLSESVK